MRSFGRRISGSSTTRSSARFTTSSTTSRAAAAGLYLRRQPKPGHACPAGRATAALSCCRCWRSRRAASACWSAGRGAARRPARSSWACWRDTRSRKCGGAIQKGQPQMTVVGPARHPAAGRPGAGEETRPDRHRLAEVAGHAREDHRRVQPHPHAHAVGTAHADVRQLRRGVRPDLRVPAERLVPDRQRRCRAAARTR